METTKPAKLSGNAAMAVRFRLWRERTLPRAAYRLEAALLDAGRPSVRRRAARLGSAARAKISSRA